MDQTLKNDLTDKMNKAIIILEKELSGLRTGRSSGNLLDPVVVEVYGSKMPISQVGTVSTPDAKTISVQVWARCCALSKKCKIRLTRLWTSLSLGSKVCQFKPHHLPHGLVMAVTTDVIKLFSPLNCFYRGGSALR